MAGFCRVGEAEGADAVLEDVGEGEEAAFGGEDVAEFLDAGVIVFAAEDVAEPFDVVLLVADFFSEVGFAALAEGEAAGGDVGAGVVVEGCSADVFVLYSVGENTLEILGLQRLTSWPSTCHVPPTYSGFSGVRWILASLTITCRPF